MSEQLELVKWYTRARRFPQLIGRTLDGTRIWGGPYTVTQVVAGVVVLAGGYVTMPLWAHFGFILNMAILAGVTYGCVWALGRIPLGSRSPLSVATGFAQALVAPSTGRIGGRPIRLRRPHAVRHRVVLALPAHGPTAAAEPVQPAARSAVQPTAHLAAPAPPAPPSRAQGTQPPRKPALSGVQAILAAHPARTAQGPAASPEEAR